MFGRWIVNVPMALSPTNAVQKCVIFVFARVHNVRSPTHLVDRPYTTHVEIAVIGVTKKSFTWTTWTTGRANHYVHRYVSRRVEGSIQSEQQNVHGFKGSPSETFEAKINMLHATISLMVTWSINLSMKQQFCCSRFDCLFRGSEIDLWASVPCSNPQK